MGILIGIIFRGTAFTFRHYDVLEDETHRYYDFFFRASSLLTPLFLGMTLGAMILGRMTTDYSLGFYDVFISPWLNWFCITLGLFSTTLFAYIASIFLVGEVKTEEGKNLMIKFAKRSLIVTTVLGILTMLFAHWEGFHLAERFIRHPLSLVSVLLATILIPIIFSTIKKDNIIGMRIATAAQVAFIFIGWAVIQFPDFIRFRDGSTLSMYNAAAPNSTFTQMVIALSVGLVVVIPAFFYLFKIFKSKKIKRVID
jgi:cytochrome d ubiquinol oxidase subunit II